MMLQEFGKGTNGRQALYQKVPPPPPSFLFPPPPAWPFEVLDSLSYTACLHLLPMQLLHTHPLACGHDWCHRFVKPYKGQVSTGARRSIRKLPLTLNARHPVCLRRIPSCATRRCTSRCTRVPQLEGR